MAKFANKNGIQSNKTRVFLRDSTTGLGKTGLDHTSSGLQIAVIADNESAVTSYTSAGSTIEAVTVIGTYAAPSTNKVRFKAVDGTLFPGLYEIQLADARFAVSGARSIQGVVRGVTGVDPCPFEIQLDAAPADVTHLLGTAWLTPAVAGTPDVNTKTLTDGAITAAKIAAAALNGKGDWNTIAPANSTIASIYAVVQMTDSSVSTMVADVAATLLAAHGSGSWQTATGFSTLTASGVWSHGTRGLTEAAALDSDALALINKIEASTAGTVSGAGTDTEVFVGSNVTLTITVDADGNRSAVVVS